jgi:hypothetical protein
MILVDDLAPAANNWAAFVSNAGASVTFTNLSSSQSYNLWVDFVKFRNMNKARINSRLKIYADGVKIAELVFGKLEHNILQKVVVPRDHTFDGKVTIKFEEIAARKGVWGAWDMMLSSTYQPKEQKASVDGDKKARYVKKSLAKPKRKIVKKSRKRKKISPHKKKKPKVLKKKRSRKPFEELNKNKKKRKKVLKNIEVIRKKSKDAEPLKKEPQAAEPSIKMPAEPKVPEVKFEKKEDNKTKK